VNEPDFVIKFSCKNCGQQIRVPKIHAGKKGKCPKCKNIVVVPTPRQISAKSPGTVSFTCSMCQEAIKVPETSRGKLIECPKCGGYVDVPSEEKPAAAKKIQLEPRREDDVSDKSLEALQRLEGKIPLDETEETRKRKLPWIIDIFLYPVSQEGLITLGIIIVLKLLTDIAAVFLACCLFGGGILSLIIRIVIVWSYMYWYFCECIRDSAVGGLRAPETLGSMPGVGEMVWQFLRLLACYAFFFGPVTFYHGWTYSNNNEINGVIFWSLLTYGVFFFPMGILAVVMFDSVRGLNPILLIRSIISAFFQYCGLVILFYGLAVLLVIGRMGSVLATVRTGSTLLGPLLVYILIFAVYIWLLLVAGHLLGRFYWRYQEKLNWEV